MQNFNRLIDHKLSNYLEYFPCIAILGPRQVGKTTTAMYIERYTSKECIYIDLESEEDAKKMEFAESYFKERQEKLIIIDEIQRNPKSLPLLRSVIDAHRANGRFILLGSASPELLARSSETLAGRIAYLEMHPLTYHETKHHASFNELWLKGGFPNIYLQKKDDISMDMRTQFIQTYLERELPILGLSASSILLKNLLRMMAHAQGQLINYSNFSNSLGVEVNTIKRYIDYFEQSFIIRRIYPYHPNTKKRIVKTPKIYIRDTGILHSLFDIANNESLDGFIGKGNSWESFVIQQIIAVLRPNVSVYFYRTQDGTELNLVIVKGETPVLGIEIKYTNAPKLTRGTLTASKDFGDLPILVVTHSVSEDYNHREHIRICSFEPVFHYLLREDLAM